MLLLAVMLRISQIFKLGRLCYPGPRRQYFLRRLLHNPKKSSGHSETYRGQQPATSLLLGLGVSLSLLTQLESNSPKQDPVTPRGTYLKKLEGDDQIRLLCLHPGLEGDVIQCSPLPPTSLLKVTEYEAISYCWATKPGTKAIIFDGSEIIITESAHIALSSVRHHDDPRQIWIDSLCINQNDTEELSAQVRMMGRIYSKASRVLVCLGDVSKKTTGALESIMAIRECGIGHWKGELDVVLALLELPWFERVWVIQEISQAQEAVVHLGKDKEKWENIAEVCELLHNSYESSAISFTALENIKNVRTLERIRENFKHPGKREGLFDLVMATSKFKATNPRDKIFALIGLAHDVTYNDWEVSPNYDLTVEEVFRRFALWNMCTKKDLRILSWPKDPENPSMSSLPSWVPDLSESHRTRAPSILTTPHWTLFYPQLPEGECEYADGNPKLLLDHQALRAVPVSACPHENNVIRLQGKLVDKIELINEPCFTDASRKDYDIVFLLEARDKKWEEPEADSVLEILTEALANRQAWLQKCFDTAVEGGIVANDQSDDGEPTAGLDQLWRTLICNRSLDGQSASSWYKIYGFEVFENLGIPSRAIMAQTGAREEMTNANYDPAGSTKKGVEFFRSSPAIHDLFSRLIKGKFSMNEYESVLEHAFPSIYRFCIRKYYPAMGKWSEARRFCTTSNRRLAQVPCGTESGDAVCIILGAAVPYVLRPHKSGKWEIIGECYVDGIMNGEAIENEIEIITGTWKPTEIFEIN
jgi:hypothetical protein